MLEARRITSVFNKPTSTYVFGSVTYQPVGMEVMAMDAGSRNVFPSNEMKRRSPSMSETDPRPPMGRPTRLGSFLLAAALLASALVGPSAAVASSPVAARPQSPAVAAHSEPASAIGEVFSAAEIGREIAVEADRRDTGWGDYVATLRMILRNARGEQSTLELRTKSLEVAGDGDKLLLIFDRPAEVRNAAFLTFTHQAGADDHWLYLPALKRVTRIASKNKSDPFMGSEFSYEDLTSPEVDKYTYRWLRNETADGLDLFVVERHPVDENSGYTRQVVWIDKQEYRTWKVDFYDREGVLLKTLRCMRYQEHQGDYWRPGVMRMVNHRTGKSTTLDWRRYEFGNGLGERDFDKNGLAPRALSRSVPPQSRR